MSRKISLAGIRRLSLYYRHLSSLEGSEQEFISSEDLAGATGYTAAQVRRDLTYFGSFGTPGRGYKVEELRAALRRILGKERAWNVALVGVGNLGSALLAYRGFQPQCFDIVAAFDNDIRKIGKRWEGVEIRDISDLGFVVSSSGVRIGIVAVPASSAQRVVDELVSCGVEAILNFAPVRVSVPEGVVLQNVDLSIELDRLCYLLENPRK